MVWFSLEDDWCNYDPSQRISASQVQNLLAFKLCLIWTKVFSPGIVGCQHTFAVCILGSVLCCNNEVFNFLATNLPAGSRCKGYIVGNKQRINYYYIMTILQKIKVGVNSLNVLQNNHHPKPQEETGFCWSQTLLHHGPRPSDHCPGSLAWVAQDKWWEQDIWNDVSCFPSFQSPKVF